MEVEDDNMFVLVVVGEEDRDTSEEVFADNLELTEIENIFETAEKHGQYISVDGKVGPMDQYQEGNTEFIEEDKQDMKFQENTNDIQFISDEDNDYNPQEEHLLDSDDSIIHDDDNMVHSKSRSGRKTKEMLSNFRSFIEELRQQYNELRDDEVKLVKTVEQIMRNVRPPDPPRDYYIMNGIMFECVECGNLSVTIPAAGRHYHEKHGQRYLVCFACGDDFRSTINLYKHEKRCRAPDAHIVLKARAAVVGNKGRSRPYLSLVHRPAKPLRLIHSNSNKSSRPCVFPCTLCSAVFTSRSNLQSHENLHRGERPYRCEACPRAYTSLSALSRHVEVHKDVKYICDYCKRSFKRRAVLVTHLSTHEPHRKHTCCECGRQFTQKSVLQLHVNRVHRNLPPPCACQICPKRFPRMSLLKEHMKKAHGLTLMTREMLFKILPTLSESELKEIHGRVLLKPEV